MLISVIILFTIAGLEDKRVCRRQLINWHKEKIIFVDSLALDSKARGHWHRAPAHA